MGFIGLCWWNNNESLTFDKHLNMNLEAIFLWEQTFQASLGEIQFSLGHVKADVFDVLPINTPLQIHQIICIEEDGREVITDGEDLLQSKYEPMALVVYAAQCNSCRI